MTGPRGGAAGSCAILFVGFQNWGKSTLIKDIFGRKQFPRGRAYSLSGCGLGGSFVVVPQSNDDLGAGGYIGEISAAWGAAPPGTKCLVSALCPTREPANDARTILASPAFAVFEEVHLILIRYKWDFHAKLITDVVTRFFKGSHPRVIVHVLDECGSSDQPCCRNEPCGDDNDRRARRLNEACRILAHILARCKC